MDDWGTIWQAVLGHVNATKNCNMKFIFEYGYFNYPDNASAGEYAWPQPYTQSSGDSFVDNTASQLWWCGSNVTNTGQYIPCDGTSGQYLDEFYSDAETAYEANNQVVAVGLLYKGFDDTWANWGLDRVIAQQCGRVLMDSANEVALGGYWGTTAQIPYMQMATWNDYEEGTEEEGGINNCYTSVDLTYEAGSETKITWTLGTVSWANGFATTAAIHHYALYTAPHGGTTLTLRGQISHTATQFNLSSLDLPAGSYDVYIQMVGQPSMQNQLSNPLEYTVD